MITVYAKLMGSLLANGPWNHTGLIELSIKNNSTPWEAVQELGIPMDRVKLVLINHAAAQLSQLLKDGDKISIFPPEYPVFPDWRGSLVKKKQYQGKTEEGEMKKWKCSICDYIYDPLKGDAITSVMPGTAFEEIPEDWVCPTCGAPKDMFEIAIPMASEPLRAPK